jgi:hypothetical protein
VEEFDAEGIFWLPENEEMRVAGRLTITRKSGAKLALIGAFHDITAFGGSELDGSVRIFGIAGKKHFTLDGCQLASSGLELPGIHRQTWISSQAIAGALIPQSEEFAFDEMFLRFDQLLSWIRRSGITMELTEEQATQSITEVKLTLHPLDSETEPFDGGALTVGFTWGLSGDHLSSSTISQNAYLKVSYDEERSLDDNVQDAISVRDLLTLCVDEAAAFEQITFTTERYLSHGDKREQLEYLTSDSVMPGDTQKPDAAFATFEQIGGTETLARWIPFARKHRQVLNALLSVRYAPSIYSENRYQNLLSAAETLHRQNFPNYVMPKTDYKAMKKEIVDSVDPKHQQWVKEQLAYSNEPRLRARLKGLVDEASTPFAGIVDDLDKWLVVVTTLRNRLVHNDEDQPFVWEQADLYFLGETVYLLVLLCLFRSAGVPTECLDGIANNRRVAYIKTRIPEIIDRLYPQTRRR